MGLSYIMIEWIEALHRQGCFDGKQSILELGPQDIVGVTPDDIHRFAQSVTRREHARADIEQRFFDNGQQRWWTAIRDLYALLGLNDYHAADMDDERADFAIDLNQPVALGRTFDVITDFGTIEHVFNIGAAVKFIHDHLAVGGIALHVLPTRGDYNHGFFNIHSTFYLDLCSANGYELVDFKFLPGFSRQSLFRHKADPDGRPTILSLGALHGSDDYRERDFARAALAAAPGDTVLNDYIFAALRKVRDADFVYPMQGIYSAERVQSFKAQSDAGPQAAQRRIDLHLGLARDYLKAGRWTDAQTQIDDARAIDPDHPEALYLLALTHSNAGRLSDAIAATEQICQLTPGDGRATQLLALLRELGRPPA